MKYSCLIVLSLLAFSSCKKEEEVDQRAEDQAAIQKYLDDRNWDAMSTSTGLHYIVLEEGNGVFPVATSDVTVTYEGKLADGAVFDESTGVITFNLQEVILGWREGIPYFSEGGSGILLIPSHLGYGSRGSGGVPPNSIMVFEVDLIEVE